MKRVPILATSIGALAVDVGAFLACLAAGVTAGPASALGYSLGILAHWLMSSRAVFRDNVAAPGRERTRQKALFVMSALVGLVLTTVIITLADRAGMDPRAAKAGAVARSQARGLPVSRISAPGEAVARAPVHWSQNSLC